MSGAHLNLSAAVLAGGMSTRMGRDKALIELNRRPLIVRVFDRLNAVSDDVFAVTKDEAPLEPLGVRVVVDDHEAQSPIAGIARAMRAARYERVFVCACDTPFLAPKLIALLASKASRSDVVVPRRGGRPEPLHAVWSAGAAQRVSEALDDGELAVHRIFDHLDVVWVEEDEWKAVDPRGRSFVNLNTPSELDEATRG
jgi:molybdopterin-guanine dinucleotide biosynthesis protein A